ncbi:MAG: glycosyltransferase [Desulfurococcales archaeon]|jgi:glycosyltransferase involved in cell wall biosynthesis|nr:glycosyltransferase [Desulfurococcales archaeon]
MSKRVNGFEAYNSYVRVNVERINCIYAVVPSLFGSTGDAVNERQFITTLAEVANANVKVFAFVSLRQAMRERRYLKQQINELVKRGVAVIPLPMFPYLTTFYSLIIFILVSFYLWMKIKLGVKVLIYIRTSNLALGFLEIPEVAKRSIVKIPAILEDENLHISIIERKLLDVFDRKAVAKAGAIAFPSPLMYVNFLKRRRVFKPLSQVILLPAGVNSRKLAQIKIARKNSDMNDYKICFLGLLQWWQGVDILVKAVALLKNKFSELRDKIKLEIIGDGPQRALIERLCQALGVNCELTGYLPHEDALKRLSGCGILVLPRRRSSTTEAVIPLKVIEAWALSIPVVVTRHKIFEFYGLKDGEDLVYCEPTPKSVADALGKVFLSENVRIMLREKGPIIAQRFDYYTLAKRVLNNMRSSDNIK